MTPRFVHSVVFITGAATMLAELAAGRLVAPFYGTSTLVWALVIGAVLANLALGQMLGGRLVQSERFANGPNGLGWLLLASSALLLALPLLGAPIMSGTLTWFRAGNVGTLVASFAGITLLLAGPMLTLGACGPVLLHLAAGDQDRPGAVAGRIYALGTVGSLVGTYLAGLVLIPWVGTRATLWLGAAGLGLLGVVACRGGRKRMVPLVALSLFVGGAGSALTGPFKARPGAVQEVESPYQYIQVAEAHGVRSLYLNDGYAVQSVLPLDGSLYLNGVWGYYALAPAWTTHGHPQRILLLGLGGGTSARTFRRLLPEAHITGVELDPEVVELGRRWFELPADMRVLQGDARAALETPPISTEVAEADRYDLVVIDAFQFPYIPFQLCTVEFFQEVAAHLAPGGAVVLNAGRDQDERSVVEAVAHTLNQVLPVVRAVDVRQHPNTIIVGTRHVAAEDAGPSRVGYPADTAATLGRLPRLTVMDIPVDTPVLTDDRAPVESMSAAIILRRLWALLRGEGWS